MNKNFKFIKVALIALVLVVATAGISISINGVPVLVQNQNGAYSIRATFVGAVSSGGTAKQTIYVMGYTPIEDTITVPATKAVEVKFGGYFAGTGSLVFNGPFECGVWKAFTNTGTVTGLKEVLPELFGGNGTDSIEDTAAMQKAINSSGTIIFTPNANYIINDVVFVGDDKKIIGNGASFTSKVSRFNSTRETPFIALLGSNNVWIDYVRFVKDPAAIGYDGPCIRGILSNSPADNLLYDIAGNAYTTSKTSMTNIKVTNCQFIGIGNHQFVLNGGTITDVTYEKNTSIGCIRGVGIGYSHTGTVSNLHIDKNTFTFDESLLGGGSFTTARPVAVKLDGNVSDFSVSYNVITNNIPALISDAYPLHMEANVYDGVVGYNTVKGANIHTALYLHIGQLDEFNLLAAPVHDVLIIGNRLQAVEFGVHGVMPRYVTITKNIIVAQKRGVLLENVDTTVPYYATAYAVDFMSAYGTTAYPLECNITDDNRITITSPTSGFFGAKIMKGKDCKVDGNNITYTTAQAAGYGVYMDLCTTSSVSGNTLTNNGGGIQSTSNTNNTYAFNKIKNGASGIGGIKATSDLGTAIDNNTIDSMIASITVDTVIHTKIRNNTCKSSGATTIEIKGVTNRLLALNNTMSGSLVQTGGSVTNVTNTNSMTWP